MKRLAWLTFRGRTAPSTPLLSDIAAALGHRFDDVTGVHDPEMLKVAMEAIDDQLRATIDRNADGVNAAAIRLRRETDLLLALGISDALAAQAGSHAQMALEMANAGRGVDLQAQPHRLAPSDRAALVSRAMVLMMIAEKLMDTAKSNNRSNIEAALSRQEQLAKMARRSLTCQPCTEVEAA